MTPWVIWLIAAVLLLILEVGSQAVWAFCFAIGCLAAMVASIFSDSLVLQALFVAVFAIGSWIVFAPVVRKWEHKREPQTRTGMDALIGRRAVVVDEIRVGQTGRVRIDGDCWQVQAPDCSSIVHKGAEVLVTGYDSIILTVKPV